MWKNELFFTEVPKLLSARLIAFVLFCIVGLCVLWSVNGCTEQTSQSEAGTRNSSEISDLLTLLLMVFER